LFRKSESAAYDGLVNAVSKDQLVLGKVKLSDVVEIGSSGLAKTEFDYATRAHLDFVIYNCNAPILAVEVDCTHKDTKGQQQADLKDRICSDLGLTFFRLDYRISDPNRVQTIMASLIRDFDSRSNSVSGVTDIVYKRCVTHGGTCESSACSEFQSIAEFIFICNEIIHPNHNEVEKLWTRVNLQTTCAGDGYFESEVSLVSSQNAQLIGEGRCRCSKDVYELGRVASQRLALANASETLANVREGLYPSDQECILTYAI